MSQSAGEVKAQIGKNVDNSAEHFLSCMEGQLESQHIPLLPLFHLSFYIHTQKSPLWCLGNHHSHCDWQSWINPLLLWSPLLIRFEDISALTSDDIWSEQINTVPTTAQHAAKKKKKKSSIYGTNQTENVLLSGDAAWCCSLPLYRVDEQCGRVTQHINKPQIECIQTAPGI